MSTVVDPETREETAAAPATVPPPTQTCPNCGAPADQGQLMCLECGARLALGYRRPPSWRLPAAVVGIVLLIAGIGVALALASVTDNANKTTAAAPTQPTPANAPADTPPTASQPAAAPTASPPTPAPTTSGTTSTPTPAPAPAAAAAPSGWPPGKSAFTVVLASM